MIKGWFACWDGCGQPLTHSFKNNPTKSTPIHLLISLFASLDWMEFISIVLGLVMSFAWSSPIQSNWIHFIFSNKRVLPCSSLLLYLICYSAHLVFSLIEKEWRQRWRSEAKRSEFGWGEFSCGRWRSALITHQKQEQAEPQTN